MNELSTMTDVQLHGYIDSDCADEIIRLRARIKELETISLDLQMANQKLAALRAKIENAEVVAWQTWISGFPATTFHNKQESEWHFARMNREYPDDSRVLYALIRKEDLLK